MTPELKALNAILYDADTACRMTLTLLIALADVLAAIPEFLRPALSDLT